MLNKLKQLGPGLLYAGAAIGVSHLVQSTRAGANFGFTLIWVIVIAHFFKYPFFQFGPRYASATGESLLDGYKKMGNGREGPKGFRKAACGYHLNGGRCGWGVDGMGCGYSHPTFWSELEQCGDDKIGTVCSQGFFCTFR